jgi:SAM-dependent methyltransferase
MRSLPFRRETFGGVVNMFTSFGYFEGREEDERVLEEVSRVLRPSGWFFLDYVNAESLLARLVPASERRAGERRVREIRSFEPRTGTLTKEVRVLGDRGETIDAWVERLTLYAREEIEEMLRGARFLVRDRFGEYDGRPVEPGSARLIFFCVRSGGGS